MSIYDFLLAINTLVLAYFVFINSGYLILIFASFFHIRKYKDVIRFLK